MSTAAEVVTSPMIPSLNGLIVGLILLVLFGLFLAYVWEKAQQARRYEQHKRNFDEHYHTHTARRRIK